MDFTFPEKYFKAAEYFDYAIGDLETTTALKDEQKLLFYALRQQAEHGPCKETAPSLWHVRERYKHQAWCHLRIMSRFEAMVKFVSHYEAYLGGNVNWVEKMKEIPTSATCTNGPVWDADIIDHSTPTVANIHYLATQLMLTRQKLLQSVSDSASASEAKAITMPVSRDQKPTEAGTGNSSTRSIMGPPQKPISERNGVPPPLKPLQPKVRVLPVKVCPQLIAREAARQAYASPQQPKLGKQS